MFAGRIRPTMRYNRLGQAITLPSGNREIGMLRELERQGYKGTIRVRNSSRFKKGFYKFGTKKITLQSGKKTRELKLVKDLSKSRVKLPKRAWLRPAVNNAIRPETVGRFYKNAFERYTRQRPQ